MRFLRALALPMLLACLSPQVRAEPSVPAPVVSRGLIYVLNSGEANILVLDAATREEVRRIPVLREVHHLALTPKGDLLMVGDSGANEMLFINPASGEMVRRETLSNPYHMGFSPDGLHFVITSLRRDQVDLYGWDGTALTLAARLRLPDMPSHMAFSPDSKIVYVTLQGTRELTAISLETNQPLWSLDVGPQPAGLIWHEGRLLVGIMGSDHIAVVNPETRLVERTIKVGRGAHALFPAPARAGKPGLLYVTSRVDSRITVLDPATLEIVRVLDVPGGPDCVSFDPQGRLWVTQRWIGRIALVDPETGVAESQRVGRSPHGILFEPGEGVVVARADAAGVPVPAASALAATPARLAEPAASPAAASPPAAGPVPASPPAAGPVPASPPAAGPVPAPASPTPPGRRLFAPRASSF